MYSSFVYFCIRDGFMCCNRLRLNNKIILDLVSFLRISCNSFVSLRICRVSFMKSLVYIRILSWKLLTLNLLNICSIKLCRCTIKMSWRLIFLSLCTFIRRILLRFYFFFLNLLSIKGSICYSLLRFIFIIFI